MLFLRIINLKMKQNKTRVKIGVRFAYGVSNRRNICSSHMRCALKAWACCIQVHAQNGFLAFVKEIAGLWTTTPAYGKLQIDDNRLNASRLPNIRRACSTQIAPKRFRRTRHMQVQRRSTINTAKHMPTRTMCNLLLKFTNLCWSVGGRTCCCYAN